jgi:hypothetical protein
MNQLLATEGPAILGWRVRGAVKVLGVGLRDPAGQATSHYEISEGHACQLVQDECRPGSSYWCNAAGVRNRRRSTAQKWEPNHSPQRRSPPEHPVTREKATKASASITAGFHDQIKRKES